MGLTKLSINRPLTMLMIILGLVVMGFMGYSRLQVDRIPKADIPYVSVVVVYPGASPDDVSGKVLEDVEDAVAGVSGIKQITSQANENFGAVTIEFQEGTNGDQAALDVSREIDRIKGSLPDDAEDPLIIKADINATPIMQIVLSGPQGQDVLYKLADEELKPRLQAVSGVASVSIAGGRESEVRIEPDPVKMSAYNLSLSTLQQILEAENVTAPSGSIDQGDRKNALRSVGEFTSLEDIENVVVAGRPNALLSMLPSSMLPQVPAGMDTDGLVYLRDVAQVNETYEDTTRLVRYNGQSAVLVTVVKTSDANAIAVADAVHEELDLFSETELLRGAELDVVIDNTRFTRESVAAVQEDLLLVIVITGVIMLLFLHTINNSLIVMLSVPTSLIVTFLGMWLFGFSLNALTLMALTMVIAIVVDDSIVVLENIERHLKMGKSPIQAAIDGRSEIGLAAITITFVIVVVYLPVSFMSGIVGQFFLEYGITVAVATLLSLLVSFTLTPMLAAFWLKGEGQEQPRTGVRKAFYYITLPVTWIWDRFIGVWETLFTGLSNLYAAVLRLALKNVFTQVLVVAIAAVALYAGIYLVTSGIIASELIPQEDDGQINITIEMPAGTNLAATNRAALRAEQIIVSEVPELAKLVTNVGSGAGNIISVGSDKANSATMTVKLVDKADRDRSTTEVVNALRPALKRVPAAKVTVELNGMMGASTATELRILGPDQDVLIDLAQQAESVIQTVPGVVDIRNNGADRSPETRIVVDRRRATDLGLYPGQVALDLRTAVNGTDVGSFEPADGTGEVDIVLRMPEDVRQEMSKILQLPLGYANGQQITVGQVAALEETQSPGTIQRLDRQPSMLISFGTSGRGSADVANDVEAALRSQIDFPAGYDVTFVGMTDIQRDAFAQLAGAMALSVLLIYMLLVALYQSWLQPLAILFVLPVTVVGAFGGLLLTGNSINMVSLLGVIMLIGIVAKNAILLVDYTNILRRDHGYNDIKAALVEAGRVRLRPILMTVFAIVFALMPLLCGQGAGSELRAPMAAVLIGGNISSTLLTLLLVPVMYYFFEWLSATSSKIYRKIFGTAAVEEKGTTGKGSSGGGRLPEAGVAGPQI
jgi:HAE1 family hydrophobic/amphiphilic exporter-1